MIDMQVIEIVVNNTNICFGLFELFFILLSSICCYCDTIVMMISILITIMINIFGVVH
jgi:hypothetical protein